MLRFPIPRALRIPVFSPLVAGFLLLASVSNAAAQGPPSEDLDFSNSLGSQLRVDIEGLQARLRNLDVQLQQTLHPPLEVCDEEITKAKGQVAAANNDVTTMQRQLERALQTNSRQLPEIARVLKLAQQTLAREQGNLNYWQSAKLATTNLGGDIGGLIGFDMEDTAPVKDLRRDKAQTEAQLAQREADLRAWDDGTLDSATLGAILDGPGAPPVDGPFDVPPVENVPGDFPPDLFNPLSNPGSVTEDTITAGSDEATNKAPGNEATGFDLLPPLTDGEAGALGKEYPADGKYAIGVDGMKLPVVGEMKGFVLYWKNTGNGVAEVTIPMPAEMPKLVTAMLGLPEMLRFRVVRQGQSGRYVCEDAAFQALVKGIIISADALQQEALAPKSTDDSGGVLDQFAAGAGILAYKQNATAELTDCRFVLHDYGSGELRLGIEGSARVSGTYNGAAVQGEHKFAGANLTAHRVP